MSDLAEGPLDGPAGAGTSPSGGNGDVTVRYFAGARAAAGMPEERFTAAGPLPLPELVELLGRRHGPELSRVLTVASFLIDEVPGSRERVVPAGAVVDVLPPFAGG